MVVLIITDPFCVVIAILAAREETNGARISIADAKMFTILCHFSVIGFFCHVFYAFFFTSFSSSFVGGKLSFVGGKFGSQLPLRSRKLTLRN